MMILEPGLRCTLAALNAITDPRARMDAFTGAILAEGGTVILPVADGWGAGLFEFSLHSVLGRGATAEEALAQWLKCATRVIEAEVNVTQCTGTPEALVEDLAIVGTRSSNPRALDAAGRLRQAMAMGLQ